MVPLTQMSAEESTPLMSRNVCSPVSVPTVRSARYHHGTVKSLVGTDFMFVEKNGSAYLPLASSPAKTVERAATGNQPAVAKPGLDTALSSLIPFEVWIRKPGIAAELPG